MSGVPASRAVVFTCPKQGTAIGGNRRTARWAPTRRRVPTPLSDERGSFVSHLLLAADSVKLDTGNTAWMLTSAALVLLMTPGLAFFYGGMVRSKSVLNMLMLNFICIAVVGIIWAVYGFSLAFGNSHLGGFIGGSHQLLGLGNPDVLSGFWSSAGVPIVVFAMFQLMFAIITPALISGAVADRTKFWG